MLIPKPNSNASFQRFVATINSLSFGSWSFPCQSQTPPRGVCGNYKLIRYCNLSFKIPVRQFVSIRLTGALMTHLAYLLLRQSFVELTVNSRRFPMLADIGGVTALYRSTARYSSVGLLAVSWQSLTIVD